MPTSAEDDNDNEDGAAVKSEDDDNIAAADGAEAAPNALPAADGAEAASHGAAAAAAVAQVVAASLATPLPLPFPEPDTEEAAAAAAVVAAVEAKLSSVKKPTRKKRVAASLADPLPLLEPETEEAAATAAAEAKLSAATGKPPRKKRRLCKFPGCSKTVKAQGHCQRHGAKTKRCKAKGCLSQAQGSHEGYCKRHWRQFAAPEDQRGKKGARGNEKPREELAKCQPVGSSVYDEILPASFGWKPDGNGVRPRGREPRREGPPGPEGGGLPGGGAAELGSVADIQKDVSTAARGAGDDRRAEVIPILRHLLDHEHLGAGWHRCAERLSRGIRPPKSISTQLESWEKQLAVLEMALVAGTDTGRVSHNRVVKVLAHAWGREKGFHKLMLDKHCARRGDLDRKKRVDAGVPMSAEKKMAYRAKFEATKAAKRRRAEVPPPSKPETLSENEVVEDYGELPAPGGEEMEAWQIEEGAPEELGQEVVPPHPMEEVPPEEPPPVEEPSIEVEAEEVVPGKIYEM